jgi:hypothetical protein
MEGAAGSTTADDASTAGSTATEERSEDPVSGASGTKEVTALSIARRPSSGTSSRAGGGFQLASEEYITTKQLESGDPSREECQRLFEEGQQTLDGIREILDRGEGEVVAGLDAGVRGRPHRVPDPVAVQLFLGGVRRGVPGEISARGRNAQNMRTHLF